MAAGRQPRFVFASMIAPLPATALAAAVCVGEAAFPDVSSADDAPARAAVLLLVALPFGYLIAAGALYGLERAFDAAGVLSRRSLLAAACLAALLFAALIASTTSLGPRDALISFAVFGTIGLVLFVMTAVLWWRLAAPKKEENTAPR